MKYRASLVLLVLLVSLGLLVMLCGCGGGGGGTPGLSQEQIAQIEGASQSITAKLTDSPDPGGETSLEEGRAFAQTQPNVQSAAVIDGNLVVQYKNAGQEIWVTKAPLPTPPADLADIQALSRQIRSELAESRAPVGTRKAVLINALYDDPAFGCVRSVFADIEETLTAAGFGVQQLYGAQANPDAMRELGQYSVVVLFGHGGIGDGRFLAQPYCVQTGAEWEWYSSRSADWVCGRIAKVNVEWGTGDQRAHTFRSFAATTGKYWSDSYAERHFSDALFLNLACSGAKYESFRNALFGIGVAAYTGWTEPQGKSPFTAWYTLALMAEGRSLGQAATALPDWYKSEANDDGTTAELWYGPESGLATTLGGTASENPNIVILSPDDGVTLSARECTVEGMVSPWPSDLRTQVIVNGQSSALPIDADGQFSQPVGLRQGSNTICVRAIGAATHSAEVTVIGSFTPDILYTALWWNQDYNDIDVHLVPVDGADGDRTECYYRNKTTSWGAVLDVDDVNGYGPEHITARTLPSGKYLLYVYYYSTHEQVNPSVVNVAVSANGCQSKIFSLPSMLSSGDRWNVCYISYPSGAIEAINSFVPATRGAAAPYPAKPPS